MNKAVLEGLLFVVGEDGLTIEQIEDVLNIDEESAKNLIRVLKHDYEDESRGLRIDFLGNRFKLTTKITANSKNKIRQLIKCCFNAFRSRIWEHLLNKNVLSTMRLYNYTKFYIK